MIRPDKSTEYKLEQPSNSPSNSPIDALKFEKSTDIKLEQPENK